MISVGCSVPKLNVSYKPQKISPKFPGTVRELMHKKIREAYTHPQFISDVMKPLNIEAIMDNTGQAIISVERWCFSWCDVMHPNDFPTKAFVNALILSSPNSSRFIRW